ncbi:SH3 domain-containing protein 19-like [Daktulosphaira vitifoliae]|uniref:SH3 domain-containing protein 19-like n=1 Tax=Daktulosphaira vitifoliae TaxID=58002 RepID=UPI0021AA62F9|nr:SH3 domain-containing protein 19-like [Daktulosphaira vitifoliae]
MSNWTAFTSEKSPKIPNRPAPPPPKTVKSSNQTKLAKVLSLKPSKSQYGVQQPIKKKPPPRPPPPKFALPQKSQSKTGLSTLIGFKAKHSVPTPPPWVGKQNEIKITSGSSKLACLIDLSSPPTSPTSTHKSSSDGNSVDSFNSDFGPWKESQAESSGFEDDFDLLSSHVDTDYLKKTILNAQNIELSPPPPSLPPPMLPPDALNVLLNGPQLPPRPSKDMSLSKSQCVAQFDYFSEHPDDLVFKQGDEISLIRKVNDEWLEGELDGRSGMFPINYVIVRTALLEEISKNQNFHKVIAVFSFKPECWEDLNIQEGDEIQVLRRINDDWLYGECNGSKGQFPSNFVTELPEEM